MVNFSSDNVAGVHPKIMEALARANEGREPSYGADPITRSLEARFTKLFERPCKVFPLATGTAANALALSQLVPPYGAVFCHAASHIQVDECGAPEFFSSGAKLIGVKGASAKIGADNLAAALYEPGDVHNPQPAALSISQSTELGAVYSLHEIQVLGELCRRHALAFHMDGARFANALVALDCSPAEMTWKAGVDVLSFGATKNGAMAAEALVFFNEAQAENFAYRRKRAGQLLSKMRFVSAQLEAYLEEDLWLKNARHANATAKRLAAGLAEIPGVRFLRDEQAEGTDQKARVQDNGIFVFLPKGLAQALRSEGYIFGDWGTPGSGLVRLMTSYNTKEEDVDSLIETAKRLATAPA